MHTLKPTRFASLFQRTPKWTLSLEASGARITHSDPRLHAYTAITHIEEIRGFIWSSLHLIASGRTIILKGVDKSSCQKFTDEIIHRTQRSVNHEIDQLKDPVLRLGRHLDTFLSAPKYLAQHDLRTWQTAIEKLPQPDLARLRILLRHPYLNTQELSAGMEQTVRKLNDVFGGACQELAQRNLAFVKRQAIEHVDFFDSIESQPLTDEQRKAAIVMEDRNLLIAAAGSGKSSTVVAKIGYVLKTNFCDPEQVLAVVFNRNAREELELRLSRRLPEQGERVIARTFHKLGKEIIAEVEGKQPSPAPWEDSSQASATYIEQLIKELLDSPEFLANWVLFRTVCFRPNRELSQFKNQQDYERYIREVGQERDGQRGILTLNGELVRSMEELAIANWLFLNGINYQYERAYEFETANREYQQYHPDFYYPDIDLYHEHFALDDQGKAPPLFKGDYEAGVIWKRALHTEKKTALMETTSAMYRKGELFGHLQSELEIRGAVFKRKTADEILERLNQKQTKYAPFLRTFITHLKSNGYTFTQLAVRAREQRDSWRASVFMSVLGPIFELYQAKLKAHGYIDYEDMVRQAAEYVAEGKYQHPYRMILVDEFQDISQAGAALIKAMLTQRPDCKLFAVGDDWQSINRFAGADIDIMARFQKRFGHTATNYLTRTFRSNQGISDVAASFVQANPIQYRKSVIAKDKSTENVLQILEYGHDEDVESLLAEQLNELAALSSTKERCASVYILARYNHLRPKHLPELQQRFRGRLTIEFKSAHRSKGLEADFVVILGMTMGPYSFPSQIEDDPLLDLVMPAKETHPHAEERRLFYVALTRARHKVIIFTKRSQISRFIPELLAPEFRQSVRYGIGTHAVAKPCSDCGTGVLREKHGKFGRFMGCSNFPECRHTEKIGKPN